MVVTVAIAAVALLAFPDYFNRETPGQKALREKHASMESVMQHEEIKTEVETH